MPISHLLLWTALWVSFTEITPIAAAEREGAIPAMGSAAHPDPTATHHLHVFWASLSMEGRQAEAMKIARQLARTVTEGQANRDTWKARHLAAPLWTMIRFGQWDPLLRELPPPKTLRLQQAVWRLGRGLALSSSGRLPGAEGEHAVLAGMIKKLGRDRSAEEKTERVLVKIAERLLAGDIAMHQNNRDAATTALLEATKLEDELPYSEPPLWPIPIRHYLGALLLKTGLFSRAESVYRADLGKNPQNGWAYYGLLQSLRLQQKKREATRIEAQFKRVWAQADVSLTSSRF
ncbi:MAG: tetratricopeptide repeat protein [Nitrospira sp.]